MSRKTGSILVGVMGILLAGLVVFNLFVPPRQAAEAPRVSSGAVVGAMVGQVEVRSRGDKRWSPAVVGAALAEGDEVRTGLFSETTLHLRGSSSVTISPNTSFVVGQDQVQRSSFKLGEGRITAAIPSEANREYLFLSRGSEAVASIERGEFSLATDGKGTVVVDTRKGTVRLRAAGKEVKVSKGKRSVVLPDKPPSDVLPVPSSVALQVKWPPVKSIRNRTRITGKTSAAAMVMVNGILVRADEQGRFSVDVPLREGKNRLVVTTTDASGNTSMQRSPEIRVDTRPPDLKVDIEGLWK